MRYINRFLWRNKKHNCNGYFEAHNDGSFIKQLKEEWREIVDEGKDQRTRNRLVWSAMWEEGMQSLREVVTVEEILALLLQPWYAAPSF